MKTIDEIKARLTARFGAVEYSGKLYILTRDAYLDHNAHYGTTYYSAYAIGAADEPDADGYLSTYEVTWDILPEKWEEWAAGDTEEGDACDWSSPAAVREYGICDPADLLC